MIIQVIGVSYIGDLKTRHIQIYKQLFKEMSSFLYGLFASPRTVCPGFCLLLDPRTPGKDGWDK